MSDKSTDEMVLKLLDKIKSMKSQVQSISKKPLWKTTCTINISGDKNAPSINIMTVRDNQKLIEVYIFLNRYHRGVKPQPEA